MAFEKRGATLVSRSLAICGFMPLRGPHEGPSRRALLSGVPWESGNGPGQSHWIAVFDEATQARQEALEDLLSGVGSARATPPLFAGWSARLALGIPDPICLFPAVPGSSRSATGLFDPDAQSLAVVVGETLYPFGDPSCGERLTAFLSEPNPLDLAKRGSPLVIEHREPLGEVEHPVLARPPTSPCQASPRSPGCVSFTARSKCSRIRRCDSLGQRPERIP